MNNDRTARIVDEFWSWLWKKENVKSNLIIPLCVTGLMLIISVLTDSDSFKDNLSNSIINLLLEFLLVFLVINVPRFLMEKMTDLSLDISKNMNENKADVRSKMEKMEEMMTERIDKLPQLMAFHTEGKVFEDKINKLQDLTSSPRWIYSKYISKLLCSSFKEFIIKFSKTTDYSEFSSEVMKECSRSVYLTSSMTPYEWLSSLSIDKDKATAFFNNVSFDIDLNENNHSIILSKLPTVDKKNRIVCLDPFDYDHLFLFEQSLKKYLETNAGIETRFVRWNNQKLSMEPLTYEYALYDESLLFKFKKETKELIVLKDGEGEFSTVKEFFDKKANGALQIVDKDSLLQTIKEKKESLLKIIKNNNQYQIPHKYAYLFHDKWTPFIDNSQRFGQNARNAIADLIDRFDKYFIQAEDIVEIGAGYGDKIDLVCDRIGTDKINSYYLVDISKPLMNDSFCLLRKRFEGKKTFSGNSIEIKEIQFDFCGDYSKENKEHARIFSNRTVLILNNSTLFSELNFPWDKLKQSKKTIVTLDLFEQDKVDYLFGEYYKARELFLSPLKIFGIPIVKELIDNDDTSYKDLFFDNRNDSDYSNVKDPYYKIYFNLKKYLEQITATHPQIIKNNGSNLNGYADFVNSDKIVVLSSLKFKKTDNYKTEVSSYFQTQFGKRWNVVVEDVEHSDDSYIGVCIEKNS